MVISIIGVLAGLTLTGFTAARKNARDATRKSDLAQYKAALEAYAANNNGRYPSGENGDSFSTTGIFFTGGSIINEYLPAEIDDPTNTSTYRYVYSGTSLDYTLYATLETSGYWVLCSSGFAGKRTSASCPY